jgi:hypothetical protein
LQKNRRIMHTSQSCRTKGRGQITCGQKRVGYIDCIGRRIMKAILTTSHKAPTITRILG